MYRKVSAWIMALTLVIATLLICFNYVVSGALILIAMGVYSMVSTISREVVRTQAQNNREFDYAEINAINYIDLISCRGNIYSVYDVNPDEIMDSI